MRRLRRFWGLPGSDRGQLLLLVPQVAAVRLALWVLPYAVLSRWAAQPVSGVPDRSPADWARLVRQAASAVPGASCLTQALVLQRLLHGQGAACSIRLGVRRGETGFAAHAWVTRDGQVLLGGPDVSGYVEFPS